MKISLVTYGLRGDGEERTMVENVFSASALLQHVLQPQQVLFQAETSGSDLLRVHYQQLLKGDQVRGPGVCGQEKYPKPRTCGCV